MVKDGLDGVNALCLAASQEHHLIVLNREIVMPRLRRSGVLSKDQSWCTILLRALPTFVVKFFFLLRSACRGIKGLRRYFRHRVAYRMRSTMMARVKFDGLW
jgi:hypothetical protein